MNHLTRQDYANALDVLARIEANADSTRSFTRATAQALTGFVASEFTTLSVCDLLSGHRHVVRLPTAGVPAYGLPRSGVEYGIAVPLFKSRRTQVSVVLSRRGVDFDERDRERLALLRPHLAFLYRHASRLRPALDRPLNQSSPSLFAIGPVVPPNLRPPLPTRITSPELTQREAEVLHWLAGAKTDAEIAALLSISRRTVQKHLEHIYVKLGVETRTAAVMRAFANSSQDTRQQAHAQAKLAHV